MKNVTHAATKNVVNAACSMRLARMANTFFLSRLSAEILFRANRNVSNAHQMRRFHLLMQCTIHCIVAPLPEFLPATSTGMTNIRHGCATDCR
jgi:hypothetical protein